MEKEWDGRPDPELLLRQNFPEGESDGKGKLKIFFRVFSQPVKTQVSLRKREQRNLMFQENFRLVQEFALRKVMPEQEWWQQIVLR